MHEHHEHQHGHRGHFGGAHLEARLRDFWRGGGWGMPGGGPGGPGGPGGGPFGGRRGGRSQRPNVRAAVLALLAERPMHGYEMITELESRTSGMWRPSPGSVYPTLQLLEDEGLIVSEESGGRRRFTLTAAGRAEAEQAGPAPWEHIGDETVESWRDLRDAAFGTMNALRQVMTNGTDEQRRQAIDVIAETKKRLYAILAE